MEQHTTPRDRSVEMEDAVSLLRARVTGDIRVGVVLGSGLGPFAEAVEESTVVPYEDIPGMPVPAVPGHAGRLIVGRIEGVSCAVLQGRAHFYEGHSMVASTYAVRLLGALGIGTLIVTNASGGLNPDFGPGDAMLITDHLFLPGMAGFHPLRGPNDERAGPRFPAMVGAYDEALRALALEVPRTTGIRLQQGVYAMVSGPSYETSAELRFLRAIGADAVGMSTCPEVVVARHQGMKVLGISLIANLALHDHPEILTHDQVVDASRSAAAGIEEIVRGVIRRLP
jgi:purine-nucleoside phosphorylase